MYGRRRELRGAWCWERFALGEVVDVEAARVRVPAVAGGDPSRGLMISRWGLRAAGLWVGMACVCLAGAGLQGTGGGAGHGGNGDRDESEQPGSAGGDGCAVGAGGWADLRCAGDERMSTSSCGRGWRNGGSSRMRGRGCFIFGTGCGFMMGGPLEAEDVAWTIGRMIDGTLVTAKGGAFAAVDGWRRRIG